MSVDGRAAQRWRRLFVVAAALLAVSACTGGDDVDPVGVEGYSTVIDGFLPATPADGSRPVVYVARLGEEPFALEDQVAMIASVEDSHDLRFVDDVEAAVDDEHSDAPPRDDGLLIGVGTISIAVPHVVRVEVYNAAGDIEAHKVTLTVRNDVWRVDTSEPIDPEVLVGDD